MQGTRLYDRYQEDDEPMVRLVQIDMPMPDPDQPQTPFDERRSPVLPPRRDVKDKK